MARPPRPEHEVEHRRAHILDAASKVFASRGFEAASIEEIAREAGYGASTLYGYFVGKRAIVTALVERFLDDMESVFDLVLPSGLTLRQSLELFLRNQLGKLQTRRAGLAFMLQRGMPELEGHEKYMERDAALQERFAIWVSQHALPHELGPYSAEQAARLLNGLLIGELMHWVRQEGSEPLVDRVPVILDFFFHGVAGPPASGAPHV
jgi:AcrR family transcriptional regulator